MGLNKYAVPAGVKEGVWFSAQEDETVRFRIKLPHQLNVAYRRAMMDSVSLNASGGIEGTLSQMEAAQDEIFFKHCLAEWQNVELNGGPLALNLNTAKAFFEEYPLLLIELKKAATEAATQLDKVTEELEKN